MRYQALTRIKSFIFGYRQIAKALSISPASARVSANRYVRQGFLIRIKRNTYVLAERWRSAAIEDKFIAANLAQVPSYVSLMTALDYYGITTQVQRDFIESIGTKRARQFTVGETILRYTKIDDGLYFGFSRQQGFFMASPEKAFLDAFYLKALGRYSFDISSINMAKLDKSELARMAKTFPAKIRRTLKENGYITKT